MITVARASIFELPADVRINTVNTVGVMGAGVALAFRRRYPDMFRAYELACERGEVRIGSLHTWRADDACSSRGACSPSLIVNFPTKMHWREKSRYEYVRAGLVALRDLLATLEAGKRVVIPALGCGNGGLDWSVVLPMIKTELAPVGERHSITILEPLR